jgi:hypothetical protein
MEDPEVVEWIGLISLSCWGDHDLIVIVNGELRIQSGSAAAWRNHSTITKAVAARLTVRVEMYSTLRSASVMSWVARPVP